MSQSAEKVHFAEQTPLSSSRYARDLSARREAMRIEQFANFGLALGWVFLLIGGFCWFCVVSQLDGLWFGMFVTGFVLLAVGVLVPEVLETPCRWWMRLAHWQGWLVMTVLLSVVYFLMISPVGRLRRARHGSHPFHAWDDTPPAAEVAPGWEPLRMSPDSPRDSLSRSRRSLPGLLLATIGFFVQRGHYLMLPILIVLLALGLLLFFVQGSVLAPFIYTLF